MKRHWIWGALFYALLLGGGFLLGKSIPQWVHVPGGTAQPFSLMVLAVAAIYMLASALPFVPGAEIGFALMMVFGGRIAILVYLCMVLALWLAFGAGQLVPKATLTRLFVSLRMKRAAVLVRQTAEMSPGQRRDYLLNRSSGRVVPFLLKNRYLAMIVVLNMPGNVVLGGGGGIALFAGMSRLFSTLGFCLATALAVAPVPVIVMLLGYQP